MAKEDFNWKTGEEESERLAAYLLENKNHERVNHVNSVIIYTGKEKTDFLAERASEKTVKAE